MRKILIVGGGYAGFYTAWKLEKKLSRGEAEATVVDRRPYMTYHPFLPEVVAGSIEARHAAVSLRRHLKRMGFVTVWSPQSTTHTAQSPSSPRTATASSSATTSSSPPPERSPARSPPHPERTC